VKIAMNKVLSGSFSFALIVLVSPSYAQQLIDVDVPSSPRTSSVAKLAQVRGYSASGTHQCGSSRRSCVVTGSGFTDCNDALSALQTRDCCPTTPAGGHSSAFTLNYCIPDRPL
jgi:hypothetical protein